MVNPVKPEGSTILGDDKPAAPKTPETILFPGDSKPPTPPTPAPVPEPAPAKPEPPAPPAKVEEPPKEEPKPDPGAKPAPANFELKLPEGSLLTAEDVAAVKAVAKTAEEGAVLLKVRDEGAKSFLTRQNAMVAKEQEQWKQQWEQDPDYGRERVKQSTELAKRAWDRLADPELKKLAVQTGLGNHPMLLRMMARIGSMLSEDSFVRGSGGGIPDRKEAPEKILYGETTPGAPAAS